MIYTQAAHLNLTGKLQHKIKAAMDAVANGRETRLDVSSWGVSASIGIRKADDSWATTIIPYQYTAVTPEQKLIAFMGFSRDRIAIESDNDAIEFAQLWVEEHCND
jgi:hypothetical protein